MSKYDSSSIIKLTKKEILVYLDEIISENERLDAENAELRLDNAELECALNKFKRKPSLSPEVIDNIKNDIINYHSPSNFICQKYHVSRTTLFRYGLTKKDLLNGEHI